MATKIKTGPGRAGLTRSGAAIASIFARVALAMMALAGAPDVAAQSAANGASLWTSLGCDGCHGASPTAVYRAPLNAANAPGVINYAAGTGGMTANPSASDRADIAAYIAQSTSANVPNNGSVPFNPSGAAPLTSFATEIAFSTTWGVGAINAISTVAGAAKGSLSYSVLRATPRPAMRTSATSRLPAGSVATLSATTERAPAARRAPAPARSLSRTR